MTPLTRIWQSAWVPARISGKLRHYTRVAAIPAALALFTTLAASSLPLVAGLKISTFGGWVAVTVMVVLGRSYVSSDERNPC